MDFLVFDLGGTLMEYQGMPPNWSAYYPIGLQRVNQALGLHLSAQELEEANQALRAANPRISGREVECPPEELFRQATESWHCRSLPIEEVIELFFEGLPLCPQIYEDAVPFLQEVQSQGGHTAALTDLPSGMPDQLMRRGIWELLPHLEHYVSSGTCGFRKPNPAGLLLLAEQWGISPAELCLIGDEEKDEKTAVRAGCRFIKIDRSGREPQALHSLMELSAVLERGRELE